MSENQDWANGNLFEHCKKVRPRVIADLSLVPDYVKAIEEYAGEINDEVLYEITRKAFLAMCKAGSWSKDAQGILNKISKDVKGEIFAGFESKNPHGIGFIFRACDAPGTSLSYWVTVPEFVGEIKRIKDAGVIIDNAVVFGVMKGIYKEQYEKKNNGVETDFKFYPAHRGLIFLSDLLLGDKDAWAN